MRELIYVDSLRLLRDLNLKSHHDGITKILTHCDM